MKIEQKTERYQITFGVDTHLPLGKIETILAVFDCFNIRIKHIERLERDGAMGE